MVEMRDWPGGGIGARVLDREGPRQRRGQEGSREEIARVAYELFERRGGEHGHDWEDWFKAEQVVRERARSR
jgi:hypothetical protein